MPNDSQPLFKGLIRTLMLSGAPVETVVPPRNRDLNGCPSHAPVNRNFDPRSGLSQ